MKGFATSIDLQSVSFEAKLMWLGCRCEIRDQWDART